MEEQDKDLELYVPKSPLDGNVKRMAWLLFLEVWKVYVSVIDPKKKLEPQKVYSACLDAARVVWHEQEREYDHGSQ